ncbi:MAPEG family protein [Croceicoccus pelagius]|uniref:Membrane protein n=1 Tax=Croceicoccus pelagius TaxID=1703341 RepID=A0A917DJ24_9SPHN|nr:MAPEG family protein [Croceicoccus pelagius]GGD43830.1 membrane protein [Croceicoccus pelagius]
MPDKAILIPAALLVCWTMVMAMWMLVHRAGTFSAMKTSLDKLPVGARGPDLWTRLPEGRNDWPAHNYMHLMEQPTIYYPAVVILAIGGPTGYDVVLAWAYLVLRVIHSIYQAKVNLVKMRATLFILSTLVMMILSVRALLSVLN